jgi:hypothetical protein
MTGKSIEAMTNGQIQAAETQNSTAGIKSHWLIIYSLTEASGWYRLDTTRRVSQFKPRMHLYRGSWFDEGHRWKSPVWRVYDWHRTPELCLQLRQIPKDPDRDPGTSPDK